MGCGIGYKPAMNRAWHVAKTKAGQDHVALDNLQRQNFEPYYPRARVIRRRRGRMIEEYQGLFPGYIFIKFSRELDQWKSINSTRGVQRLLSFSEDGTPSTVPDREVDKLKAQENQIRYDERLHVGDRIKVKNCSVFQPTGTVVASRGQRIEFLMRLLGREVRCIAASSALYLVGRAHRPASAAAID